MFVRPIIGEDLRLIRVLEGKLDMLTQRVPTLQIEKIEQIGVHIYFTINRKVAKAVLVYIDAMQAAEDEEAKESRLQRDHGDQGGPSDQGGPA